MIDARIAATFALALAAAPLRSASADVKTIPMDAFKLACQPPTSYIHNPAVASVPSSASGTWCGVATLKLPAGSAIQEMTYYRWADGGSSTTAYLDRTRPTEGPESLGVVFDYATTADHHYYPVDVPLVPGAGLVVRKGYLYFVTLHVAKGAGVSGVKVRYKPPAQ